MVEYCNSSLGKKSVFTQTTLHAGLENINNNVYYYFLKTLNIFNVIFTLLHNNYLI